MSDALRERIEAATGPIRDMVLTGKLGIHPCHEGDHETVLPCPHCGAAL